jgi:hypothetical protein
MSSDIHSHHSAMVASSVCAEPLNGTRIGTGLKKGNSNRLQQEQKKHLPFFFLKKPRLEAERGPAAARGTSP